MKKIFLFEPSIASNNVGDQIIVDSIKREMNFFLKDSFYVEFPTHSPISNRYMYFLGKPDMKIICGSNIIVGKLNTLLHLKQWMLSIHTIYNLKNSIFIGVGSQQYNQKINLFTRIAYKYLFKKDFLHSVRDSYTNTKLKNIGITNVINTGCPTMWCLTKSHCLKVPTVKSKRVVFTLTDYKKNIERDNYMISVLNNEYDEVHFWPQGYGDFSYFSSLEGIDNVTLVPPHVLDFDQLLDEGDIDFIGTRLHGGIRALQKLKRTLIIGVDNRANELNKDFNLPVLDQSEIKNLSRIINQEIITDIKLPLDNINMFLAQFKTTKNKQL